MLKSGVTHHMTFDSQLSLKYIYSYVVSYIVVVDYSRYWWLWRHWISTS